MFKASSQKCGVAFSGILFFLLLWATLGYANTDFLSEKVDKLFVSWDKPDSPGCALGIIQAWAEGKKQGMYESIQLEEPTPDELEAYVGRYYSEELNVAYILRLKKGNLFLQYENPFKSYPHAALGFTLKDRFRVERWPSEEHLLSKTVIAEGLL